MSGFSESVLQKKLTEVNNTLPSIQTLSLWLLHHRKHSASIVKVWYGELKKEKQARRLLNLIHLANDVIQNSRKKWPKFREQFQDYLENAFGHIARHADAQIIPPLRRVIDVWEQRAVFEKEFLEKLTYSLTSNLTKELLALANENAARTPPPQKEKVLGKRHHKQKSFDINIPTTPPSEKTPTLQRSHTMPSPAASKILLNLKSTDEIIAEAPSTEEVLRALRDLENTASADVETRERIAQFPADVADPSKLRQISSRLQADRFASLVNEADQLLTSYNSRLADELSARKTALDLLQKYIQGQKSGGEREAEELIVWKEKLVLLNTEMNDFHQHVDSLPDLSKLRSDFTQLPPLPSAGDLFLK